MVDEEIVTKKTEIMNDEVTKKQNEEQNDEQVSQMSDLTDQVSGWQYIEWKPTFTIEEYKSHGTAQHFRFRRGRAARR